MTTHNVVVVKVHSVLVSFWKVLTPCLTHIYIPSITKQDLCSELGPSRRRSSKRREKKAVAKATSKALRLDTHKLIPYTTASEPVLHIFTTRVTSNNFDHNDTAHTYDGNHAFDFQPKKIVLRPSVVSSTDSELDEKSLDNLPCYTKHGTIVDDRGLGPIHKACAHFASDAKFIGKMISNDPNCSNVPTKLPQNSFHLKRTSVGLGGPSVQCQKAPTSDFLVGDGQCAIHIALSNNPSVDVIKLLMNVSIVTLSISDCNGRLPLSLALRHFNSTTKNNDMEQIIDMLIAANPQAVFTADKRMNTPLHYACMMSNETKVSRQSTGSSLMYGVSDLSLSSSAQIIPKFIKKLASLNPDAIHQRNFNGSTPLDLLQYGGGVVNDELLTFLQELAFEDIDVEDIPDL